MKKVNLLVVFCLLCVLVLESCSVAKMNRFAECEFEFLRISKLKASDVSIMDKVSPANLSFMNAAKVTGAFASQNVPIEIGVDLVVKNPNEKKAALNQLDYIIVVDGEQVLKGTTYNKLEIDGLSQAEMPLSFDFELFETFSGKSAKEVLDIIWDLAADTRNPKNLQIKVKPYFYFGERIVKYPGYISVMNM